MRKQKLNSKFHFFYIFFILLPLVLLDLILINYFKSIIINIEYSNYNTRIQSVKDSSFNIQVEVTNNLFNNFLISGNKIDKIRIQNDISNFVQYAQWIDNALFISNDFALSGNSSLNIAKMDLFKTLIEKSNLKGDIVWSKPKISEITSSKIIAVYKAYLNPDKSLAGFLYFEINPAYFMNQLRENSIYNDIRILFVNKNYTPIIISRRVDEPVDYRKYIDLKKVIDDPESNIINIEDTRFYTLVNNIELLDLYVVNLIPYNIIRDKIRPILIYTVFIISVITAIVIIIIFLVTNMIVSNINNINNHILNIKNGDFSPKFYKYSSDEFFRINKFINKMARKIESNIEELRKVNKKNRALVELRTTLLHVISHNSASPITVLLNNSQYLMQEFPDRKNFEEMYIASKNLKSLIDNLLIYLKIDEGLDKTNDIVDLSEITENLSYRYKFSCNNKDIKLKMELEDYTFINSNQLIIEAVIENLISNAVKYSSKSSTIYITCKLVNSRVIWQIKDGGPGFSETDISLMYNSFTTLSAKPTGGEKSTGLGLYIIKTLLGHIRGDIELRSSSSGSEFTLTFNYIEKI